MIFATFPPNLPRPRVANVLPEREVAVVVCHKPAWIFALSAARFRARARIMATVCWVVLSGPFLVFFFFPAASWEGRGCAFVPVTIIPNSLAAAKSMAAFLIPVVSNNRKFGNSFKREAGKGVRSRMHEMMV